MFSAGSIGSRSLAPMIISSARPWDVVGSPHSYLS